MTRMSAQVFQFGLVGGPSFSYSNSYTDYDGIHTGIHTGLVTKLKIKEGWFLSSEILYVRNGNYIDPKFVPVIGFQDVRNDYLKIPFSISKEGYNPKNNFSLGISYLRLIYTIGKDGTGRDFMDQVEWGNQFTFTVDATAAHYFNSKFGVDFRISIFKNNRPINVSLSTRSIYLF